MRELLTAILLCSALAVGKLVLTRAFGKDEPSAYGALALGLLLLHLLFAIPSLGFLLELVAIVAGGALYVDGFPTHFTITDSTFTGNSTEANDGGAINLRSWLTLDISGSSFSDNVAGYDGGAIFLDTTPLLGPVATASISDTTSENNEATWTTSPAATPTASTTSAPTPTTTSRR